MPKFDSKRLKNIFYADDLDLLITLTEAGADLNVQGWAYEWSPIMKAAYDGKIEIVRFLKDQGVDLDLVDIDGDTALDLAELTDNNDISDLLAEK